MSNSAKFVTPPGHETRLVVIVVYPGVTLLDVAGPAQVFTTVNKALAAGKIGSSQAGNGQAGNGQSGGGGAKREAGGPCYRVLLASPHGGEIATDTGITLGSVSLSRAAATAVDTLILAGGEGVFEALSQAALLRWIAARQRGCRRLATTCMGAFLAAEAGLLDGRTVTTHWKVVDELQRRYPKIDVHCDPLFIRDGNVWSSAGVTAGIDLALAMLEDDHGHDIAMQVAQSLVVFLKRPGGQSQFSRVLAAQKQDGGGRFSDLHAWIAGNLQRDLTVETLADCAAMSPRSFARLYKQHTGLTPAKSVEMMRVDAAKRLLEQSNLPPIEIAERSGLVDEQRLRRAFLRHLGVTPQAYRRTFGRRTRGNEGDVLDKLREDDH